MFGKVASKQMQGAAEEHDCSDLKTLYSAGNLSVRSCSPARIIELVRMVRLLNFPRPPYTSCATRCV